ncbi:MAG: Rieske 2Fe-2S domain-containing protein [Isosphaeraceae bacterium]|nr:Rieske 2Fe-2S domain-containing protein [Isosphaeraceae bacterium]
MNRRSFYQLGSVLLGSAMGMVLAIPGVAYFLDPLNRKVKAGELRRLTTLSQLKVGVPQAFAVIDERQDAWVKYPKEPVGSVWLVRQADGQVTAFSAECPHLGCAVGLSADRKSFLCPCHTSAFDFDGTRKNQVPPRGMDTLKVELTKDADPAVLVEFQRFQTQTEEKKPLV